MGKKEELAVKYTTHAFIDREWCLQARFLYFENIFAKKHIKKAYIDGWNAAIKTAKDLIKNSKTMPPEFSELVEEHFDELI